ncbi:BTB/POZ protein [Rhizophagus irregularis DAOM 181602=DAOM 197198]|nr:BTB/POZ protein [Rhizophagus irregularis DAOM 181602=DAOM 197198]
MYDNKFLPKLSHNLLEILEDNEFYDINIEVGNEPYVKIFRTHMDWMEQNFNLIYKTSFKNNSFMELRNFCTELMSKEPEKIFNSIDFISLSKNCLISLIQHDNFQISDIQVWEP